PRAACAPERGGGGGVRPRGARRAEPGRTHRARRVGSRHRRPGARRAGRPLLLERGPGRLEHPRPRASGMIAGMVSLVLILPAARRAAARRALERGPGRLAQPRPRATGMIARILTLLFVLAAAPATASAQPAELQRARDLFEQTAFEDALAVLDAVDESAGFTRADVVEWLVLRARLASALGDDDLADRELARLARLTDEVALPPDLRERFEAIARSTPELTVTLRWEDGALEAVAIDDAQLVRELRVSARELGADRARTGVGRLAIATPTERRADVIGPGGAVVA